FSSSGVLVTTSKSRPHSGQDTISPSSSSSSSRSRSVSHSGQIAIFFLQARQGPVIIFRISQGCRQVLISRFLLMFSSRHSTGMVVVVLIVLMMLGGCVSVASGQAAGPSSPAPSKQKTNKAQPAPGPVKSHAVAALAVDPAIVQALREVSPAQLQ